MSLTKAEIARRATLAAAPPYRLSDDLIDCVLAALPPLIADALPAWHQTHRKWVTKEIVAFHPADAAEARLAGEIVTLRHLAASLTGRAGQRTTPPEQARRLGRVADELMRTGAGLERELRRRHRRAVRPRGRRVPGASAGASVGAGVGE